MADRFSRTRLVLGDDALRRLSAARVAVFGLGGVGGYAAEALARAGVGRLDLIDSDVVDVTNVNRQILALSSTVGLPKVEVAAARIREINPDCVVRTFRTFFLPETKDLFDFSQYDYVADAIDTVSGKLQLIESARAAGTPVICCMGTGNKLDPTRLEVADVYETEGDPLARVMRRECRRRGIDRLKVVYSKEPPVAPQEQPEEAPTGGRRAVPGSVSFVPGAAGLILAGEIVRDLTGAGRNRPAAGRIE